jgi:flagellar biosynthetic protein FliR
MTIPFDALGTAWDVFLLVFLRMTGLFVMSPMFGRRNIPARFKIGFAFFCAILVVQGVPMPNPEAYTTLLSWVLLASREFLTGLMLGFISYAIISAMYVAGQLIDMRIGFGMVNVFDPVSNVQIPITADFYIVLTTLFMLVTDGHHLLIHALAQSYRKLPLGALSFTGPLLEQMIRLMGAVFDLGFRIAMPVTVAIMVTDMALGIISKSVPQMNVFMLGMPVKILLGLVMIYLSMASFHGILDYLMDGTYREMEAFLRAARG